MREYYECHVTFEGDPELGEAAVRYCHWKWSRIAGDPTLGTGVRQYATMHYTARLSVDTIWRHMQAIRLDLLERGFRVVRCKIERVIKDERYAYDPR